MGVGERLDHDPGQRSGSDVTPSGEVGVDRRAALVSDGKAGDADGDERGAGNVALSHGYVAVEEGHVAGMSPRRGEFDPGLHGPGGQGHIGGDGGQRRPQVVIGEVQTPMVDEGDVAAGMASVTDERALRTAVGHHQLGAQPPGPVADVRSHQLGDRADPRIEDVATAAIAAIGSGDGHVGHGEDAVALGLAPPGVDELGQLLGMIRGQIPGFGEVLGDVVELPVVILVRPERIVVLGVADEGQWAEDDRLPSLVVQRPRSEHLVVLGRVTAGNVADPTVCG